MKKLALFLVLGLLVGTAPAWSGAVYVPMIIDEQLVDGYSVATEIRITNNANALQSFRMLFIPTGTNGANDDREDATEIFVAEGATIVLTAAGVAPAGSTGMLEIDADPLISVTARLVTESRLGVAGVGSELPVVSSRNAVTTGGTAYLQGWKRTANFIESDLTLVNIGQQEASCLASVNRPDGGAVASDVPLTIAPLSQRLIGDALGLLNVTGIVDYSVSISCDQTFYAFVSVHHFDSGEVITIRPAADGTSTLRVPGNTSLPPPIPGATVFEIEGCFHRPTNAQPAAHFNLDMEPDIRFSKAVVDVDFTHGGWNPNGPNKNHSILWLNRQPRWRGNLFGYLNAFGPGPGGNKVKHSHNVNLPAGEIEPAQVSVLLNEGENYHAHFEYDPTRNTVESIITDSTGAEVARVNNRPTANAVWTEDRGFFIVFGHEATSGGPEVRTIGWDYCNMRVQFVP